MGDKDRINDQNDQHSLLGTVKVFEYIPELDAFTTTKEYDSLAEKLGLAEWNPVVWIGRYFCMDNDFGEHWFDNWEAREAMSVRARELDYESMELYVINPSRFMDKRDGPCHPPELRKKFWNDVVRSLELSYAMLFEEARHVYAEREAAFQDNFLTDKPGKLEQAIEEIRESLQHEYSSQDNSTG